MSKRDFYAGIITALAIIDLHGMDTIYEEVIETLGKDIKGLIRHAIKNEELEFSGLAKHGYVMSNIKKEG